MFRIENVIKMFVSKYVYSRIPSDMLENESIKLDIANLKRVAPTKLDFDKNAFLLLPIGKISGEKISKIA